MRRPSDAHVYAVFQKHEDERASRKGTDTAESIHKAARDLKLSYVEVRDVVLARETGGFSG